MNRGRALGPGRLSKNKAGKWTLGWTEANGKRRRKVLSTDRRTAERIRSEIVHERDLRRAGLGAEAGQGLAIAELCQQYLVDLEPRVVPRHYANVRCGLKPVLKALGETKVGELRQVDAVRIRTAAVAQGLANRTANLRLDRLRSALNWARENGLISANPLEHLRRLPETAEHRRVRRRSLTEVEIHALLAALEADDADCDARLRCRRDSKARIPQAPFWLALLETAARYGEARKVVWGDVDLGRRVLVLRAENTKSRKQRAIPIRDALTDRLRGLRTLHAEVLGRLPTVGEPVFRTPDGQAWPWHTANAMRIHDRVLEAAGIARTDVEGRTLDLHALRHTAATRMARTGVPLMHAQQLLGHSDPKLTAQIYSHLEAEDLRGAVESLPDCVQSSPAADAVDIGRAGTTG